MEVIEQAIEKIKEEMAKDSNPYMQVIGNYVLQQLEVNKPSCEKIVDGGKTISGSLKAAEKEARKVAKNNMAVLTDEEVFKIVSDYFEFEGVQSSVEDVQPKSKVIELPKRETIDNKPKKAQIDFDASFDEFI